MTAAPRPAPSDRRRRARRAVVGGVVIFAVLLFQMPVGVFNCERSFDVERLERVGDFDSDVRQT